MANSNPWGNPTVKTFRKKFIRRIVAGDTEVFVHAAVADIVAEIFNSAVAGGAQLPDKLRGWVSPAGVSDENLRPEHYGVSIDVVPGVDYDQWGFTVLADQTAFFSGDIEMAKRLSDAAEASRMMRTADSEVESLPDVQWQSVRPGKRELSVGDVGDDVMFLLQVFNCPDLDGHFTRYLEECIEILQRKWGQPETGVVDATVWKIVLPNLWTDCSSGSVGMPVRVLQALLISYDWDYGIAVTGTFDDATSYAVRHMQDTVGLRVTGHVHAPEWAYLLGELPN